MWTTPPAPAGAMPRASTATATRNPTLSFVICASRPLIRPYDDRERARGAALPQCSGATPTRYRRHDGRSGTAGNGIPVVDRDIVTVVYCQCARVTAVRGMRRRPCRLRFPASAGGDDQLRLKIRNR